MNAIRCAIVLFATLGLASCHSKGGGGGSPPPVPPPQTYATKVTAVELARAADQLALPVDGLPSTGGAITVTN